MRVFLTGATGFIGQACRDALEARGIDVIAPSSRELDLLDESAVRLFLRRTRPTHLLHTAWRPVHGDIMIGLDNFLWAKASLFLLQAFQDVGGQRAAVVGSSAEYDWSHAVFRTGVTPLKPASIYGAAKHALHLAAASHARNSGLSFVWPRVFFVYGPGEHETKLSVYVLKSLLEGRPVELTHGRQIRDYLYIRDVGEGVVAALMSDVEGEIDIASGEAYSVRHFASEIARKLEREDLLRLGVRPSPAHDMPSVVSDVSHARMHLDWTPRTSLDAGIDEMIAWGQTRYAQPWPALTAIRAQFCALPLVMADLAPLPLTF